MATEQCACKQPPKDDRCSNCTTGDNNTKRWPNRRRMAWFSMIAGLLFPLLLLVTESPQLGAIAAPFYIFAGGIIAAYFGFVTLDDNNFRDKR